jgi:tripeptide aminopeptidase
VIITRKKFEKRKELIEKLLKSIRVCQTIGEDIVITEIKDQYYNMKEKLLPKNILLMQKNNERTRN